MVYVYAALITGGLLVVSTLLNQRHAERLRRMDHEQEHREGLQGRRLDAYRDFDVAVTRQRRACTSASIARTRLNTLRRHACEAPGDVRLRDEVEKGQERCVMSVDAAWTAIDEVHDALVGVHLTATGAVYNEASAVVARIDEEWYLEREFYTTFGSKSFDNHSHDEWESDVTFGQVEGARAAVDAAILRLRKAQAIELGLEA